LLESVDIIGFYDRIASYQVYGKTVKELDRNMRERTICPDGHYSYTLWHYYNFRNNRGRLLVYQIVMIRPKWNKKGSTKDVEQEWDRYMKATDIHEQGHLMIFRAGFNRIKQIGHVDKIDNILQLAQHSSNRYDAETDHGALQGDRIGSTVTPKDFTGLINSLVSEIERA